MIEKVKQILFSDALSDDLKLELFFNEDRIQQIRRDNPQLADLLTQGRDYFRNIGNSSNVKMVKWNSATLECVVEFWDKSIYTYYGVSVTDFRALVDRQAKATTNGSNERGRWWIGKPSVGAGIHQILSKYPYRRGGKI